MKRALGSVRKRLLGAALLWGVLLSVALAVTTYEYDEHGRLTAVIYDTGEALYYSYDAAGNRTQTATVTGTSSPPGVPPSISVPASSGTGSYTVSWGAATGTVTSYQLYEATSSNFSGQALVYSGTDTSAPISGRGDGTYYYRVRACTGAACSPYRTGANATTVTLPPGVPASISVPSSSTTGNYTVSWGTASGSVTSYQLYQATNSGFSGQVQVYSGTATSVALSGRGDGTYYYRVRACNSGGCSNYRTGGNATTVSVPPGVPASISVPSNSTTGNYTISWGTASGTVAWYELYEATSSNFSGQVLRYNSTGTSTALPPRGNGTYYYRVRACNSVGCSGYRTGGNATTVTLPPGVPTSISVPASSTTGNYTISWGAAASGTVTSYRLYQATNSSFSGQTQVYSGTSTSVELSGRSNGTYYYRVRACNGSACSGYRTGGNAITVTLPPGVPASISVPSSSSTGNYTISWGAASGTVTSYRLYQATNSSFSGQTQVYSGTSTSKALSGLDNGTYYYRVRACNASGCSGYRAGANATTVSLPPPGVPPSISASYSANGSGRWTMPVSWGTSSGTVTSYRLYEARTSTFGDQQLVYNGAATSIALTDRPGGATFYYRVRACNRSSCSSYRAASPVTTPGMSCATCQSNCNLLAWGGAPPEEVAACYNMCSTYYCP